MSLSATDAHCHIGGISTDIFAGVCAINEPQWAQLSVIENEKVKKTFGLFLGEALQHSDVEIENSMTALEPYLKNASAVGEFGLDKRFSSVLPFHKQEKIFDAHIELASKYQLPCVLHCVGAWGFLLKKVRTAVKRSGIKKFVLHSASPSIEMAREFEKLGGYFSFSMRQLNSRKGAECASIVSIERIMLESDDVPSAQNYAQTLAKLAQIRNISQIELSEKIYNNFEKFYS